MTELENQEQEIHSQPAVSILIEKWSHLSIEDKLTEFRNLEDEDASAFFEAMNTSEQYELFSHFTPPEKRYWMKTLALDDIADLIQKADAESQKQLLSILDPNTYKEVLALLAYAEDDAGGLMDQRFIRLRPDVQVDVAIRYLRAQKDHVRKVYYAYVLDSHQKLLGTLSLKDLLLAPQDKMVSEMMETQLITIPETLDQEEVSRIFTRSGLSALPVVDSEGRIRGIVTVDDVVSVVQEEATEDIHKLGGTEALGEPYLKINILKMVKKRAGWLTVLFIGEMFTATAMGHYKTEIEQAVVLALFIPLIISSGGNSGSQATSLIIRALALGEVKMRDWWNVLYREIVSGLLLGAILGVIGFVRIIFWPARLTQYGPHFMEVGFAVAFSLLGVVLWGSLIGSMLPFLLRRFGLDPATASAPFVATLVDVTGLIIYFSVASICLHGALL